MEKQIYLRRILAGALVLLLALPLACGIGTASAKYLQQGTNTGYFRAKEFYFNSNMLGTDNPAHIINATYDSASFNLRNYIDSLHYTEDVTHCTLTLEAISGGSLGETSLSLSEITLDGNGCDEETIILQKMKPGVVYKVTATAKTGDPAKATTGYKQQLSATFRLSNLDEGFYYHLTNTYGAYTLEVWAENVSGTVTVKLPKGLEPDNTNDRLKDIMNKSGDIYVAFDIVDSISFASAGGSWKYTFFAQPTELTNADLVDAITMVTTGGENYVATHRVPS